MIFPSSKKSLACAALLACLSSTAVAETASMPFLSFDADARAIGLGGAYTSLAADANALNYNPGGLGLAGREVTFMHSEHLTGVTHEHLAGVADGFGVQLDYVDLGSVQETTVANPDGVGLGRLSSNDMAVSVGYGRQVAPRLGLGAAVKYVRESLAGATASGAAADVGVLYGVNEALRVGLAARNIGPSVRYDGQSAPLPWEVKLGAAYALRGRLPLTLASDVVPGREGTRFSVGGEALLAGLVPLRVGYDSRNEAGIGVSGGIGLALASLRFDYAVVPYGELGYGHRVSVGWRFGRANAPKGG